MSITQQMIRQVQKDQELAIRSGLVSWNTIVCDESHVYELIVS
jgi:hypothetical protein